MHDARTAFVHNNAFFFSHPKASFFFFFLHSWFDEANKLKLINYYGKCSV